MSTPSETHRGGTPLPPARRPTGAGRVGVVGPVLAVLLLVLAVALGREALVGWGSIAGSPWSTGAVDAVDGLTPGPAVLVGGIVAVLLGLWLLLTAFARRSRRAVGVTGSPATTTTTRDVARLASGAARQVGGVLSASSSAGRRAVDVSVEATTEQVRGQVESAVQHAVRSLEPAPRVKVRVSAPPAAPTAPAQEVTR